MATVRELQESSNNVVICYNQLAKTLWENTPVSPEFYGELIAHIKTIIEGLKTRPDADYKASMLINRFEKLLKRDDKGNFREELFNAIDTLSNYAIEIESIQYG